MVTRNFAKARWAAIISGCTVGADVSNGWVANGKMGTLLKVSGDVLIDIDNFYGDQHFITFEPWTWNRPL